MKLIVVVTALSLLRCSVQTDVNAGSSVSGNARVVGTLYYCDGDRAIDAQVSIFPFDYNPRTDTVLSQSYRVTTDQNGKYAFNIDDQGAFNIIATGSNQKTIIIKEISLYGESIEIPDDTLRAPGTIGIWLPENVDPATGYVYIPGTPFEVDASSAINRHIIFSGVPADSNTNVSIVVNQNQVIKQNVAVTPGDTTFIVNPMWQNKMRLFFNTTPTGAGVNNNVFDFPILIRLGIWNFNFSSAMSNGEDIRFSKPDGTPLAYEIKRWDSQNGIAEIWVHVDTIFGNTDSQYIYLYWGNPGVVSNSNSEKVFDTANGFQGVWHMKKNEKDTVYDATVNHYHGIANFLNTDLEYWGNFEFGRYFNGSGCIVMPQTATSKLSNQGNGTYTISAWVFVEMPDTLLKVIAVRGSKQFLLGISSKPFTSQWEMVTCTDSSTLSGQSITDNMPLIFGVWNYIVGVCRGRDLLLYVNGRLVKSSLENLSQMPIPEDAGKDFTIGGFVSSSLDPLHGGGYFKGIINEVRFSNVARSDDWIRLCYANQQGRDALVVFGLP